MEEEVERDRQQEQKWVESLQRVKKLGVKNEREQIRAARENGSKCWND